MRMKFIGREKELSALEKQYASEKFEFSVVYGRRRIGKTYLIQKYIQEKPAIYFMGVEAGASNNLEGMSKAVHRFTGNEGMAPFQSYGDLFSYLGKLSDKQRLVFVIDEYPYLASASPEISSIIQQYCDHDWKGSQLHLILCGSSMSFMEHQVLGIKSPLYGRRTAQYCLRPFTYFESAQYLAAMPKEEIAILHCATGGVADYLSYIDQKSSLEANIISLFLESNGRLYEEPSNILKQELREPRVYNDILDAIANGASKSNEIASKIHIQTSALNRYMDSLLELGIVKKEKPVGKAESRRTHYRIVDGCFRFWYRFVMPNQSAIMLGLSKSIYKKVISPHLSEYMGQGFEEIFMDYFDRWNKEESLPDLVTERGRWWGNNPKERREEEIDLLGKGTQVTFFGEAKWRNERIDLNVVKELEEKSQLIQAKERFYILFSKTGFTQGATNYSSGRKDILLITFIDS